MFASVIVLRWIKLAGKLVLVISTKYFLTLYFPFFRSDRHSHIPLVSHLLSAHISICTTCSFWKYLPTNNCDVVYRVVFTCIRPFAFAVKNGLNIMWAVGTGYTIYTYMWAQHNATIDHASSMTTMTYATYVDLCESISIFFRHIFHNVLTS